MLSHLADAAAVIGIMWGVRILFLTLASMHERSRQGWKR